MTSSFGGLQQGRLKRNKIPRLFAMTVSDVTVYQLPEQPHVLNL